jgi:hypothetical protein
MVERELQLGAQFEAHERARAVEVLGHDGDLRALDAELAHAIRVGELGVDDGKVVEHVRATVAEKLRIANPKYLG